MSCRVVTKLVYNSVIIGYRFLLEGRYVDVDLDVVSEYTSKDLDATTFTSCQLTNQKYAPTLTKNPLRVKHLYSVDERARHFRSYDISDDHFQLVYLFGQLGVLDETKFYVFDLIYDMLWSDYVLMQTVRYVQIAKDTYRVLTPLGGMGYMDDVKPVADYDTSNHIKLRDHANWLISGLKRGFLLSDAVLDDYPIIYYANKVVTDLTKELKVNLNGILVYNEVDKFTESQLTVYELSSLTDTEKISFIKAIGLADNTMIALAIAVFRRKSKAFVHFSEYIGVISDDDFYLALVNRVLHLASIDPTESV